MALENASLMPALNKEQIHERTKLQINAFILLTLGHREPLYAYTHVNLQITVGGVIYYII